MRERFYLLRYATLFLLACLLARVYCVSALPRQEYRQAPDRISFLHFGQSVALADFDGDQRIDEATLRGTGRNKNIEVRLSYRNTPTFLHFDTLNVGDGSLFAADIDHDGDNDLIWSDLLHPDDVVIWLDDGTGRFGRVCPDKYAENFVISDAPAAGGADIPHLDFAFSQPHDPSRALLSGHNICPSGRTPIIGCGWTQIPPNACSLRTPLDRGPPSLLS